MKRNVLHEQVPPVRSARFVPLAGRGRIRLPRTVAVLTAWVVIASSVLMFRLMKDGSRSRGDCKPLSMPAAAAMELGGRALNPRACHEALVLEGLVA